MKQVLFESQFKCLQAVVFDWAGTTVDFGCQGPVQAFIEGFSAYGVKVTPAEARKPMGMGKWGHVEAMCAMPRISDLWQFVHGARPSGADIDKVYAQVESVMIDVIRQFSTPIPGVVDTVAEMRRLGLRIGSCTGYPRSVGELLAARAAEQSYVPDVLVCATDVPHGRPEPDMCREVLRMLNVADPSRAVKIGDTVNDVLEGVRAGMWVIGVTLTGNLAGLSKDEMADLSSDQKWIIHSRISHVLKEAGAHYTTPEVSSCLPLLHNIDDKCHSRV